MTLDNISKINEYSKDGRWFRIGYRLQQLKKLQELLVENKENIISAIFEDLKGKHDVNLIEKINIYDVLKVLKKQYLILYNKYKNVTIPNKIDFSKGRKQNSLIIGNRYEPLSSLFIPLIYAISSGTPALLKIDSSPKYESFLEELIRKYLDAEFYTYSYLDLDALIEEDFSVKIVSNLNKSEASVNNRDAGFNVVGFLDVKDSIDIVLPLLTKWKNVGSGLLLCSPNVLLVHELHFSKIYNLLLKTLSIKIQEFDIRKPFEGRKAPDVIYIALCTTETAISFLNDEKINLFTYIGAEDYANYILKFAPNITKGAINTISLTFYDDLSIEDFQYSRAIKIQKKLNLKSIEIDYSKEKSYDLVKSIPIKYHENMGFFEQGFLIGVGSFLAITVASAGYFSYYYYFRD